MPKVSKRKHEFFLHLIVLLLSLRGRFNFMNLGRYGLFNEATYRQHFSKGFDFIDFNQNLITTHCSGEHIITFDRAANRPSYLPKSGKHTYGVGHFWSGSAQQVKKGLEVSGFSCVALKHWTALHLYAQQTVLQDGQNLMSFYINLLHQQHQQLLKISNILCVDAYFSKHDYVAAATVCGFTLVSRLRNDVVLRYLYQGNKTGKRPTALSVDDLNADMVGVFLSDIEDVRKNSARSRNTRLAAIRSFFRFVSLHEPAYLLHCQQILSMPNKRYVRRHVEFLTVQEMQALLRAPDGSTWIGRRDHAILTIALQTGLRASELINLRCGDVVLDTGAHVRCEGKGRKQRATPLRRETVTILNNWLKERRGSAYDPLFPTMRGDKMSRDALEHLVKRHIKTASKSCPSLIGKRVSPHVLRHSTAMDLLHHGVDQAVIALWLGHESIETTQVYIHADMKLKEQALAKMSNQPVNPGRFKADDKLLSFLENL